MHLDLGSGVAARVRCAAIWGTALPRVCEAPRSGERRCRACVTHRDLGSGVAARRLARATQEIPSGSGDEGRGTAMRSAAGNPAPQIAVHHYYNKQQLAPHRRTFRLRASRRDAALRSAAPTPPQQVAVHHRIYEQSSSCPQDVPHPGRRLKGPSGCARCGALAPLRHRGALLPLTVQ
jgi:hypothetical protein